MSSSCPNVNANAEMTPCRRSTRSSKRTCPNVVAMNATLNSVVEAKKRLRKVKVEDEPDEKPSLFINLINEYHENGQISSKYDPTQIPVVLINPIMHFQLRPLEIPFYEQIDSTSTKLTFKPKWQTLSVDAKIVFNSDVAKANLHTIQSIEKLAVKLVVDATTYQLCITKKGVEPDLPVPDLPDKDYGSTTGTGPNFVIKQKTKAELKEKTITYRCYSYDQYMNIMSKKGCATNGESYLFEMVRCLLCLTDTVDLSGESTVPIEYSGISATSDISIDPKTSVVEYITGSKQFSAELLYQLVYLSLNHDTKTKCQLRKDLQNLTGPVGTFGEKTFGVQPCQGQNCAKDTKVIVVEGQEIKIEPSQTNVQAKNSVSVSEPSPASAASAVLVPKEETKAKNKSISVKAKNTKKKTVIVPKSVKIEPKVDTKPGPQRNVGKNVGKLEEQVKALPSIVEIADNQMKFTGTISGKTFNYLLGLGLDLNLQIVEEFKPVNAPVDEEKDGNNLFYHVSLRLDVLFNKQITLSDASIAHDLEKLESFYNGINSILPSFEKMDLGKGGGKRRSKPKLRKVKKYVKLVRPKKSSK